MPVSAGQALLAARARLVASSQNPRRDAALLLAHVLGCDQTALLAYPERLLSATEQAEYERFIERRLASEPIQYITGTQEFFGLTFSVTPAVLIPRPETEHLVEAALAHVSREARIDILDVGTGSGAIAISLAHALPLAHVTAVDLSPAALAVARDNARRHEVEARITFVQSDLLEAISDARFDLVVSNPPYIADSEVLEDQVARYEPRSALYAGPSGLEIYRRLIPQAHTALKSDGWLLLEIGQGQQAAIRTLLENWRALSFGNDLRGISRVAIAQK